MKTKHLLVAISSLAMLLGGCKPTDPVNPTYTLEVKPTALSYGFDETGIAKTIEVETKAPKFTHAVAYAGDDKGWLEIVQSDTNLTVTVKSKNTGDSERKATISITVETVGTKKVEVTQRHEQDIKDYKITLNPTSLSFDANGEELTKKSAITTEGDGLQAKMEGDAEWKAVIEGSEVLVTVTPNTTADAKTGKVTVTNAQGKEAVLTLTQSADPDAFKITVDPASLEFTSSGEELTKTSTVTTKGTEVTVTVAEEYSAWLSAKLEGTTVSVTVMENTLEEERSGKVNVSNAEGASATINVVQKAPGDYTITFAPAALEFPASGELTLTSMITTNGTGLTTEVDEANKEWLTATIEGKTMSVTVTENVDGGSRTGTVTVKNTEGGEAVLNVTQNGKEPLDISGTWNWSSTTAKNNGFNNSKEASGTATITREDGKYVVMGIAGDDIKAMSAEPKIILNVKNDLVGVSYGIAFTKAKEYFFAPSVLFPTMRYDPWISENAFAEVTIEETEIDGKAYDRIVFPGSINATEELFPGDAGLWGKTGTSSYVYFEMVGTSWAERPSPIEYHKDIVLLRAK